MVNRMYASSNRLQDIRPPAKLPALERHSRGELQDVHGNADLQASAGKRAMTGDIDFCIALSGVCVEPLWLLTWTTIKDKFDLSGVEFHIVNKDVNTNLVQRVVKDCNAKLYQLPYQNHDHTRLNLNDVVETCDYMVRNCGANKWVCLSHFDIRFKSDWLSEARRLAHDDVAMVGHHCPIMLLNREAYAGSKVKFEMCGMDTGLMLEREFVERGWKIVSFEDCRTDGMRGDDHPWFFHMGNGSTYNPLEPKRKWDFVATELTKIWNS